MNIVVLDGYPLNPGDVSWQPIEQFGNLVIYQNTTPDELANRVKDADIVLTNKTPIQAQDMSALKKCRMVGVLATGVNIIDVPAILSQGILVCNVPAYGVEDVAEQALALLLELTRGTALHSQGVKQGEWGRRGWCYWQKAPVALAGMTLGIIGFGAIGQAMGRYGNALKMTVLAFSPSRRVKVDYPFMYVSLSELFKSSDVISLHCPLTPDTFHIINAETLSGMKNGAYLINTARGSLVDEQAAARALENGKLAGLGTDVLEVEPPADDNPLLHAPNTLITPHMAWATVRARQKIIDIMAQNIQAFLDGKPQNQIQ